MRPLSPPEFPEALRPIIEAEYPRFSASEMDRRRMAVFAEMETAEIDHLVMFGANRFGGVVPWLTQWPTLTECAGVITPGRQDVLYVHFYNCVPQGPDLAPEIDIKWGGGSCIGSAITELADRGARPGRVGFMGPLGYRDHGALTERFGVVKDLNPAYGQLRLVKSEEEIQWLRIGAAMSDLGIRALEQALEPGITERELGAIIEGAYLPWGGVNLIHFIGVAPMDKPNGCHVPKQFPSTRRIGLGDAVFAEISATFWDCSGQVIRSFTVGCEPSQLYRDLHDTADRAFDAIAAVLRAGTKAATLVEASSLIEEAGFTTCDDLVHGFGGGYLMPILGSRSRPHGPVPDFTFAANMLVVIQPNVITRNRKAGVQTGELVLVTEAGIERMQRFPRGFHRVG
jgi:Xaa-Pro dipeptidase